MNLAYSLALAMAALYGSAAQGASLGVQASREPMQASPEATTSSSKAETIKAAEVQAATMGTLPANTEVVLRLNDELSSKGDQVKVGHRFHLTVVFDVKQAGRVVIPAGTRAVGEVTMRTGRAVFGKSGKLEVDLRYIDLDGRRVPITGSHRQAGEGNTLAAVGAIFLSAPLLFVTGRSAVIPRGKEFTAYTLEPLEFPL